MTTTATPAPAAQAAPPSQSAPKPGLISEAKPPTGEAKPAEAAPAAPQQPNEIDQMRDELNRRFGMIGKKEKELREREQKWKDQNADFTRLKPFAELEQKAATDPMAIIKAFKIDPDRLLQAIASDSGKPPDADTLELRNELAAIKKDLETRESDARAQSLKAVVHETKTDIAKTINEKADTFEICKLNGQAAVEEVYALMEGYFSEHQQILPVEKAVELLEDFLYKEQEKLITGSKKLQARFGTQTSAAPVEDGQARQANQKPKNLTNDVQGQAPIRNDPDTRKMSREERLAWALSFKGRK